jgi:hypothetical protein
MKSARMYDFTIPANGSFQLNVEGEYVRIMSSTGMMELVTDTYRIGPIAAGQGQANTPFKRLTINDKSGVGNIGVILVAVSDFVDQRITGDVSVIDGGKNRAMAGGEFSAVINTAAVPSNYSHCALWNPPGSGKNIIVEKISASCTVAGNLSWGFFNALTGLVSNGSAASKKSGGVSSICISQGGQTLGLLAGFIYLGQLSISANNALIYELKAPVIVTPGYGLDIIPSSGNAQLSATIEFFEEAI